MPEYKPICPGAWAVPPSPLMLKHGNDYYTCSICGEKSDRPAEKVVSDTDSDRELLPSEELTLEFERNKVQEALYGRAKSTGVPIEFLDFVVDWIIADRASQRAQAGREAVNEALNSLRRELAYVGYGTDRVEMALDNCRAEFGKAGKAQEQEQ